MRTLLRLSSFAYKEMLEVLRQPRLVATLILGPFIILLIFGLGYTGAQPPFRLALAFNGEDAAREEMTTFVHAFQSNIELVGVMTNEADARAALTSGRAEVVAFIPPNPQQSLQAGQPVVIPFTMVAVDPMRGNWIAYLAQTLVDALGRQFLTQGAVEARTMSARIAAFSTDGLNQLDAILADLERNDLPAARRGVVALSQRVGEFHQQLDVTAPGEAPMTGLGAAVGVGPPEVKDRLDRFQGRLAQLDDRLARRTTDVQNFREQLEDAQRELALLQRSARTLSSIPEEMLINPVSSSVSNIAPFTPTVVGFYAPAVLALLLQHMAVTFGVLSIVRERIRGVQEIFSIAPIAPGEILVGKYAAYLALVLGVVAVLLLLMVTLLGVPMLGSWLELAAAVFLVAFASLGWGLLISAVSGSESQAIQYAMLTLLAAVFFSGFVLPLASLTNALKIISYSLPVTYGVQMFQTILLRGNTPPWHLWAGLLAWGIGLFGVTTLIYARQNRKE